MSFLGKNLNPTRPDEKIFLLDTEIKQEDIRSTIMRHPRDNFVLVVSRKSKGLDFTVPTCCPKIPQKDQQDPLHRPAGNANKSHQLLATQASPSHCSVAKGAGDTSYKQIFFSAKALICRLWATFILFLNDFCLYACCSFKTDSQV